MIKSTRAAVAMAVALLTLLATSLPATAASAAPDTIEIPTEPPTPFYSWEFIGQPLGMDSSTLVFDLDLPVADGSVFCWGGFSSSSFGRTWTEDEWAADPTIALPDLPVVPGDRVGVTCHSGDEQGYFDGFDVEWYIDVVESAGESVTLSDDPAYDWFRLRTDFVSKEEPAIVRASAGDAVRVVGPAGTFFPGEPLDVGFGLGTPTEGIPGISYWADDAAVSPDGSTVTFSLPEVVRPSFYEQPMYARIINGEQYVRPASGGWSGTKTEWYGRFDLSPDDSEAVSSARVGLSLNTALSFQRVRATVVITVPESFSAAGAVAFFVDGVAVGTSQVTETSNNRASILLPPLKRGRHVVTVQYAGNEDVAPSTSPPASLRIVL
jgi:hypothetical protein